MFITNTKATEGAYGMALEDLVIVHVEVMQQLLLPKGSLGIAVQAVDIIRAKEIVQKMGSELEIWAQHVDPIWPGSRTGSVLAEAVKEAGADGTLLNHSEKRLVFSGHRMLQVARERAQEVGLRTCICGESVGEIATYGELAPDFLAYEPPELIGGDVSVSKAQPEVIEEAVRNAEGIALMVGAGVKTAHDIEKALELGAKGFLVGSGITKAEDPKKALLEMLSV